MQIFVGGFLVFTVCNKCVNVKNNFYPHTKALLACFARLSEYFRVSAIVLFFSDLISIAFLPKSFASVKISEGRKRIILKENTDGGDAQ